MTSSTQIRRRRLSLMFKSMTALCLSLPTNAALAQPVDADTRVGRTVEETHAPRWPANPQAPKGAPNVLVILTDDVGFGVTSTFGGPVPTAAFDQLSKEGLRYNRFNTTALCSPTRASLLTGRLPQNVNMGNVSNLPTGYDGYTTVIPKSGGTMAEILKQNGYNTAMFGKNHLTPDWEMSAAGPYDRWPTGLGFEYFYGFLSADTSMWEPNITENTRPVSAPRNNPNYHFEADMADKAIRWMREQNATAPDKPFFAYYAPGLAHTPHHAPKEWLDKFKGQFDGGWDALRQQIFARQLKMGIIPAGSKLSPRPAALPAWESLTAEQKTVYAKLMEAFAASVAYSDHQTGRVIDEIRSSGEFDNTLIIYIQGDNGSSAEGGMNGLAFEQSTITGRPESLAELKSNLDKIGGPELYNHMPAAWAWVTNSPFPWWKQIASQAGGVRNGMVISWPKAIVDRGGLRSQYAHVSDIMPTVLEAAGISAPASLNGVVQKPLDGISLKYSFTQPKANSARRTQLYEMMENFGIYHDGWMAGTLPKRPAWEAGAAGNRRLDIGPDQRQWTLFNLDKDFTTANDLAATDPAKLKEMQNLFWTEAARNNLLPIHDYGQGTAGRPSLGGGRTRFSYPDGVTGIWEDAAPHTIGKSFTIEARFEVGADGSGALVAQGGRFGGYSLYLKSGIPRFHYNAVGSDQFGVTGSTPLSPGKHTLTMRFKADAAKPGSGGNATLLVDGQEVGSGRIGRTIAGWMTHTDAFDIGVDLVSAVSPDYSVDTSRFSGKIDEVVITIDPQYSDPRTMTPEGMRFVPGGTFLMGSDTHYPEERPARQVLVDAFQIDEIPVTNAQFARFVAATGYQTFAERAPDSALYPGILPELIQPGSLLFVPPSGPVDLNDFKQWWQFCIGADWLHPYGPASSLDGLDEHPVVHIVHEDAQAYAVWAGKSLPTEAEWECAARGGVEGADYAWGDQLAPDGLMLANYWQGAFPWQNRLEDGYLRTSPVRAYPANPFGLYDMIGNVWEWTEDWYGEHISSPKPAGACCIPVNPRGSREEVSYDPCQPEIAIGRKVLKGGSHLCAENYCMRYRPAARYAQPIDTSTCHVGFRCVVR